MMLHAATEAARARRSGALPRMRSC
jgi:hypothetical protein